MADFGPSPSHPLGWAFLGSGAAIWITPVCRLFGLAPVSLLPQDGTTRIGVLIVVASVFGILLEQVLSPVERLLFKTVKFEPAKPEQWALAWQTRWKYPVSDTEFRRHEALTSFGRGYLAHFLLGATFWTLLGIHQRSWPLTLVSLAAGLALAFISYTVWRRHTGLINRLVLSAAKWRHGKALD